MAIGRPMKLSCLSSGLRDFQICWQIPHTKSIYEAAVSIKNSIQHQIENGKNEIF